MRIGSVFIVRGTESPLTAGGGDDDALVHDSTTVACLEELATASVSALAVLLDGGPAARKTAIVRELARLARRKLVVISLSHDTEVSELIGQWLPREIFVADEGDDSTERALADEFPYVKLRAFYDGTLRILLVQVLHCLSPLTRVAFVELLARADELMCRLCIRDACSNSQQCA